MEMPAETLLKQIEAGLDEVADALAKVVDPASAATQAPIVVAASKRMAEIAAKLVEVEVTPEEQSRFHSIMRSAAEQTQAAQKRIKDNGQEAALLSAIAELSEG